MCEDTKAFVRCLMQFIFRYVLNLLQHTVNCMDRQVPHSVHAVYLYYSYAPPK
jgi:hypothetical protein